MWFGAYVNWCLCYLAKIRYNYAEIDYFVKYSDLKLRTFSLARIAVSPGVG
jgi:hypothetical protein